MCSSGCLPLECRDWKITFYLKTRYREKLMEIVNLYKRKSIDVSFDNRPGLQRQRFN